MRKLLIPLVILIAALGGYWFYWNKKAQDFQTMMEQSIAQFNDQYKGFNQDSPLIRYESIHTTGFPFTMTLTIAKPVMDVPISALLKNIPRGAGMPDAVAPAAGQPKDWIEEISYGQNIELTGNILGDYFTLKVDGDRTNVSMVDHTPRHTLISSSSTPLICHLSLGRKGNAWDMQPIFTDMPSFLDAFRSFDCTVQGFTLKNTTDSAQLFSMKSLQVSFGAKPESNSYSSMAFLLDIQSGQATAAYDSLAQEYTQLLDTFLQMPPQPIIPLSAYGEQNMNIDMRYDGPTTIAMLTDPAMRLKLDVNAFTLESALINLKDQVHIASAPEGENRTASATLHGSIQASERYDQLTADQATAVYNALASKHPTPGTPGMPATPQALAGAIPKLHDLGTVTWDIDASAKGLNQGIDAFLKQGSITLSAFDVVAKPYGIKLKGSLESKPSKMPAGELMATCLSCDALIGDGVNYLNRFNTAFMDPTQSAALTPAFTDGVRHFLHALAEKSTAENAKDIVIHVLAKDTGEITVSGKQITEVLGLYLSDIAPYLSHEPEVQEKPKRGAKH